MSKLTYTTPDHTIKSLEHRFNTITRQVFTPRPIVAGSEWANEHVYLSAESATNAGNYNWQAAPYQKEWLDVCCDDTTQKVVLMTSARVGKTVTLKAVTAFFMANDPAAILWLLPNLENAKQFSSVELDPLIRDSRALRDIVKDKRTRDSGNLKLSKRYPGGHVTLVGAESPAQLHGKTIRVLLCDETDRYPFSSGKDGDPLTLAMVRTTTFGHRRKVVLSSTPTHADISHIEREYKASDQRQFYVPCPTCGHFQTLQWKRPDGVFGLSFENYPKEKPTYICEDCHYAIPESQKMNMLLAGEWRKGNPSSTVAGFHINALYSTYMTWGELADEWKAASKNRMKLQVFVNSRLGEVWTDGGERVTTNHLQSRLEQYNAPVPTKTDETWGVGILTAGIDVQSNRIECSVYGWGADDEGALIDSVILEGQTNQDKVWHRLTDFILSAKYKTLSGGTIGIRAIAIDTGHEAERVYRWVAAMDSLDTANRIFLAVKGQRDHPRMIADRAEQSKKYNATYYPVGRTILNDHVYGLLRNDEAGPNYIHLPLTLPYEGDHPRWVSKELLDQLVSERVKVEQPKNGGPAKRYWTTLTADTRNEQWDMLCYAYAALVHLGPHVKASLGDMAWKVAALEPETAPAPAPIPSPTVQSAAVQYSDGIELIPASRTNRSFWNR